MGIVVLNMYWYYVGIIRLKGVNMARVLISMSNDFLNKVDNVANSEQRTRSELIREALRVYIKRNKLSNNLKAEENATLLTELLG